MQKKMRQHRAAVVVLFTLCSVGMLHAAPASASYRTTGQCESNEICTYEYYSTQRNFDGEQLQVTTVHATVGIRCSSVGTYGGQSATRYCMTVKDVTVDGDLLDTDDGDVLDSTEEDIPELDPQETVLHDPPISPEDKLLSQWFCFVQTADGKVVAVQHPSSESSEVVNLKKGIAAAFQTNFKGTTEEQEEDTMSQHVATYKYYGGGSTAYRYVNTPNIIAYAGGAPRNDIQLTKKEYIRYDGRALTSSSGSTIVSFGAKDSIPSSQLPHRAPTGPSNQHILADVPEYDDNASPQVLAGPRKKRAIPGPAGPRFTFSPPVFTIPPPNSQKKYDDSVDITEFTGKGEYRLNKIGCQPPTGPSRKRREVEEDSMKDAVTDSLGAKIDRKLIDQHQMLLLRQKMPSTLQTLEALHKDTENLKLADLLHRLISLESEHKPLPGLEPAVNDVLVYLNKLKGSEDDSDRKMRMLLYSFLTPEGSFTSQKALFDALSTVTDTEEKNALTSYIAFTTNPNLRFVKLLERLVDPDVGSTDGLLLAYGSLASSGSTAIEHHVTNFLLQRMEALGDMKGNDSWPLIHLIHSLGNTGSSLSIEPVLRYLDHSDLDVQLAAIGALRVHIADPVVQEGLVGTLQTATMEEQVEKITQTLIDNLEHARMNTKDHDAPTSPNNEVLLILLVSKVMQSNNSQLHELVLHYLQQLDTEESNELGKALEDYITKNPGAEDEVYFIKDHENGTTTKTRMRRGSDWDATSSIYNLIASYASRHNDVLTYQKHKAYIWGDKFGISKAYMEVAAGGFAGIKTSGTGYKLFAKAVAKGHAFGKTKTALHAEFLRRRSGSSLYQKIYAKVVGKVLINEAGYIPLKCSSTTKTLYSTQIKLFYFKYSVFIYVGTLDFYVGMYAKLSLHLKLTYCETSIKACATLIPRAALRAEGGASATILLVVRGGIEVAAEFTYQVEPEVCIHFCTVNPGAVLKTKRCINVYHSWPNNFVEIYAYYQLRKFKIWPPKFYWGSKKKWNALSKKWNLGSTGRKKLWGSCDANINCFNGFVIAVTIPPPTITTTKRPTIAYPTGPIGLPGKPGFHAP